MLILVLVSCRYDVKPDKNSILTCTIDYMRDLHARLASEQVASTAAPAGADGLAIEYGAAFHLSRQAMAFSGIDSRFWDVNEAFCTLIGLTQVELRATTFMALTLQDDLEMFLSQYVDVLACPARLSAPFLRSLALLLGHGD